MTKRVCFKCRQNSDSLGGHFCPDGRFTPAVSETDTTIVAAEDLRILKQGSNFGRSGRFKDEKLVSAELCKKNPEVPNKSEVFNQVNRRDGKSTQDCTRKEECISLMSMSSEQSHTQERTIGHLNNPALFHRSILNREENNMEMREDFPTIQNPLNIPRLSSMQYQIGRDRIYRRAPSMPNLSNNPHQVSHIRSNSELMPHKPIYKSPDYELNNMYLRRNPEKSETGISCKKKPNSVEDCPVVDPCASLGAGSQLNKQNRCACPYIDINKLHSVVDIERKRFICPVCGKAFQKNKYLKQHLSVHDGVKQYECEICTKSFTRKSSLEGHILTHYGESPFSCKYCGKLFIYKRNLVVHLQHHNNEKPFVCETCGKSFTHKSCLKTHAHTHTDGKPFTCEVCGKSYKWKYNLKYHMETHELK